MRILSTLIFIVAIVSANTINSQTLLWSQTSGKGSIHPFYTTADDHGHFYSAGWLTDSVDMDPGTGVYKVYAANSTAYVTKIDGNGNFEWAVTFPANNGSSNSRWALCTDGNENVYVAGFFSGIVDFDPGPGALNLVSSSAPFDNFLLKLNKNGNLVWAKQSYTNTFISDLNTDSDGNLYISGNFTGACDMDWGQPTSTRISTGINDGYISKLDSSGNLVDFKQFGEQGQNNSIMKVKVTISNELCAVGILTGSVDADPGNGTHLLNGSGKDYFTVKLDGSGNFVSASPIRQPATATISNVACDVFGNTFISGSFSGTVTFDPASPSNTVVANQKSYYLYKADANGNFAWVKLFEFALGNPWMVLDKIGHC